MSNPTRTASKPLAGYLRVSTAAQAESGIGLASQREKITAAARDQGFEIGAWFEDAGKSGAKMENRPGIQAALAAIRSGTLGGLVVDKVDRLGRSYDTMTLIGEASRRGWHVVALDVGLDTTSESGELVAGALTMAARFEWRRISSRQRDKFAELRRQGKPRSRPGAPREVADRIIHLRDSGLTYRAVADLLNDDGVPTARGGSEWRVSSVRTAEIARRAEIAAQAATA